MLDAGEIEVQVKNGEVTLSGTVTDRLAKRHAEDMIERVTGVRDVQNDIKVKGRDAAKR
ncbi:BON domain-containing protein [Reyranella sp.]|uniref:BON domain-containing protein n=1 Tax=Reyranella sp. TaxID=1929291 RepID=UPI003D098F82